MDYTSDWGQEWNRSIQEQPDADEELEVFQNELLSADAQIMQAARERISSYSQRLENNPHDSDALYNLYLHYANGWGELQRDDDQANHLLEQAALLKNDQACCELARRYMQGYSGYCEIDLAKAAEYISLGLLKNPEESQLLGLAQSLEAIQKKIESDAKQLSEAKHVFQNQIGLKEAIESNVFPCVVLIKTDRGVIGTGFFQHSEWLVSNAHVLPSPEILEDSMLMDFGNHEAALKAKRAFYRPHESEKSPDIVIMHGNSRTAGNNKCLPLFFSEDADCGGRISFYIYFNHLSQKCEIKYLIPRTEPDVYPMQYECADDIEPQPGCSGSPVIEARVLVGGSEIRWQFNTVGIIYARCLGQDDKKLACAIPVRQEFKQIQKNILSPELHAERAAQTAHVSKLYVDSSVTVMHIRDNKKYTALVAKGLKEFEAGKTILDIDLPEGLEKLLGRGIIKLKYSMLLLEHQKKYPEKKFENTVNSLEDLQASFNEFIGEIRGIGDIELKNNGSGTEFLSSTPRTPFKRSLFRIDIKGGSSKYWTLELQDNTGRFDLTLTELQKLHQKELYPDGKPANNLGRASSIFAIVNDIPQATKLIAGKDLAQLLQSSSEQGKAMSCQTLASQHAQRQLADEHLILIRQQLEQIAALIVEGKQDEAKKLALTENHSIIGLHEEAAQKGDALAQFVVGWRYLHGIDKSKDLTQAFTLYNMAAEQNHAAAQYNLGVMYEKGFFISKDKNEALCWYQKSAAQKYHKATSALERLKSSQPGF